MGAIAHILHALLAALIQQRSTVGNSPCFAFVILRINLRPVKVQYSSIIHKHLYLRNNILNTIHKLFEECIHTFLHKTSPMTKRFTVTRFRNMPNAISSCPSPYYIRIVNVLFKYLWVFRTYLYLWNFILTIVHVLLRSKIK